MICAFLKNENRSYICSLTKFKGIRESLEIGKLRRKVAEASTANLNKSFLIEIEPSGGRFSALLYA